MSWREFLSEVWLPVFIISTLLWLVCLFHFRELLPKGPLIRMPFALVKKGGMFGWMGALSSGVMIVCFAIIAVAELVRVLRLVPS